MDTQAQVAGQHEHAPQLMKGGLSLSKKVVAAWRKPWHRDDDVLLRREIFLQITKLVQKRGLEKNLSEIAKDVEMALYLDAASKEEYGDLNTLEFRIYSLMSRLRNSQKSAEQGAQPGFVFSKAPAPGCSNGAVFSPGRTTDPSGSGLGGILNMGGAATSFSFDVESVGPAAGIGSNMFASVGGQGPSLGPCRSGFEKMDQCKSSAGIPMAGSWMIPTPGLNFRNNDVSSNHAELAFGDGSMDKLNEPLLSTGSGHQYFGGGTGIQRGGLVSNNAQLGNIGMPIVGQVQGLVNGASVFHGSSNMKQGYVQTHPQYLHHVGQSLLQQQLYGVTGGDGYATHATNLVEGSSFYNPILPTGFATGNPSSLASTPANLISGMPSERQDFKLLQSFPDQYSSHGGASAPSPTSSILSRQQSARSLVIPNQCSIVESDADALRSHAQHPFRASPDQLIREQLPVPHALQVLETQGNQDIGWMERCGGKQCHLQHEPQKLQHPSFADQQVEHSEQACQASSADTGQSEVVSNDDGLAPSGVKGVGNLSQSEQVKRQQWLLIFLRHVSRCTDSGRCTVAHCAVGRESWNHLTTCQAYPCSYPRCMSLKWLLRHHQKCRNSKCVVCGPVRNYFSHQAAAVRAKLRKGPSMQPGGTVRDSASNEVDSPPMKRVKVGALGLDAPKVLQQPLQLMSTNESQEGLSCQDALSTPKSANDEFKNLMAVSVDIKPRTSDEGVGLSSLKIESPTESSLSAGSHLQGNTKLDTVNDMKVESNAIMDEDATLQVAGPVILQTDEESTKQAAVVTTVVPFKGSSDTDKPVKAKISGISYIESFSSQQIRQHISSLRKWIGQSKGKAEKNQAMERQMLASACSACAVENLYFDPIPIFCTQCGCRIKRNTAYHSTGSGENSLSFCGPCYNAIRADMLETDGFKVQKSMLVKKKNDEQRVEGWVECDKCEKWQHQICVLFNARINKERSEYVCPECCIAEMERFERVSLPANSVPGAKDLPRTVLSDYVEERLALKLEEERVERAKAVGKNRDEVITAEGLVVRVISSIDKKLEVKAKFLELFQQEDYPKDFLYKSKMLMLFQEIEGVEVCLFGMYVQEFGAESPQPNHRWVYLSYLDSVKYFRPDVKTIRGEALRTYVYHEILIAYLDYCKKRGFSSCYIWACPPLKGDDYILYCHPEIQKTPKTDKLREWYLSMISKAKKEKVVIANKNLYDYFFTSNGDCKAKVTAARLPYFDGDYWPGAAEDILQQLQQEEEGLHSQRRGKTKKVPTKRTTKTSAQAELGGNVSKDLQLMNKLGQSIVAMKEDFIIVHLHHACSRCRTFIISGHCWVCQQCAGNFQLCSSCYEEHQKLEEDERHPAGRKDWHPLSMEEVNDVPVDTLDRDEIMESEFFDNRQAFLSLCQGNQYQYDTLRRAKHSSMMVLYHLHNPNAPAFITSCTICHSEIEAGQGWKCKSCTDFDVCNACYSSQEVQKHPHKFVARSTAADLSAANTDLRKQRMLQLRMMLEVLVHASKCREALCQYAKCRNMKDLFRHGNSCTKRAMGGCSICKRMWFLLSAHARACKETVCTVPRCMDIRKHLRRTQLQQESRRRAAVNEMIRQRAAEAAGVH